VSEKAQYFVGFNWIKFEFGKEPFFNLVLFIQFFQREVNCLKFESQRILKRIGSKCNILARQNSFTIFGLEAIPVVQ